MYSRRSPDLNKKINKIKKEKQKERKKRSKKLKLIQESNISLRETVQISYHPPTRSKCKLKNSHWHNFT